MLYQDNIAFHYKPRLLYIICIHIYALSLNYLYLKMSFSHLLLQWMVVFVILVHFHALFNIKPIAQ